MNTPAHLLLGAAVFGRGGGRPLVLAAMAGAMIPDLSLYLLAITSIYVLQIPPNVVFDELYFSDLWQSIFAVDNSFFVWGALLALALWRKSSWAIALTSAGLLHLVLDFPLHHDDGRPHFWPFSNWVFESPVSYWDRNHHAFWVGAVAAILSLLCAFVVWKQKPGLILSLAVGVMVAAEFRTASIWMFVFEG